MTEGRTRYNCTMRNDTGYKDFAGFAMDPCNHSRPTPAAEKADVVEAVALAILNENRRFSGLEEYPSLVGLPDHYWRDQRRQARAAIAALQSCPAEPAGDEPVAQELEDAINDILSPFHWEAWKAALFSDHEEGWPDDDEQEAIVRRVDSIAVGEHYQAWAEETRAKLVTALRPATPAHEQADPRVKALVEALDWALNEIRFATRYDHEQQFWNSYDIARAALSAMGEPA